MIKITGFDYENDSSITIHVHGISVHAVQHGTIWILQ